MKNLMILLKKELIEKLNIYERCYLNHYVKIYTYFSLYPIYGKVIEVTPYMLVLDSKLISFKYLKRKSTLYKKL